MATIYITQAGGTVPDGSEAQPYSITWFNSNAAGGNTYIFSGRFSSAILPSVSGSSGNSIICQSSISSPAYIARAVGSQAVNFASAQQYWEFYGFNFLPGQHLGPVFGLTGGGDYTGLRISGCKFQGSGKTSAEQLRGTAGIFGSNIYIIDNEFYGSFYDSVALTQAAAGNISNLVVSGNSWENTGRRAFAVDCTNAAGTCDSLYIEDNYFRDIGVDQGDGWNPSWSNAEAIRILKNTLTTGPRPTRIYIRRNDLGRVQGKGITVQLADRVFVEDNRLVDISRGINGQGIGLYGVTNYLVTRNFIKDVYSTVGEVDGHGIDLDAPPDSVDNTVYGCFDGTVTANYIENAKYSPQSPAINLISSSRNKIFGNIIVDSRHGIRMTYQSDGVGAVHCADNIIVNNLVIGFDPLTSLGGVTYSYAPALQAAAVNSNVVKNNLFVNLGSGLLLQSIGPDAATITAPEYNAFWNCVNNYLNLDNAGGFANNTANDITSDPQLTPEYRLQATSPCIAAGNFIRYMKDYLGQQFWNPPSIGAIEYERPRIART